MELLTVSRMRAFRRCPRLEFYRYGLCRRPARKSAALNFGTAFHRALEVYWDQLWRDREVDAAFVVEAMQAAAEDALWEALPADEDEIPAFELAKARALARGYVERWIEYDRWSFDVLGVETQFEGPMYNPDSGYPSGRWRLAGKLDVDVMERRTGRRLIIEHKTTSADISPGADYWNVLRLDDQISAYNDGAMFISGPRPAAILYDVIRKPGIKPKLATPEESRKYTKGKACRACEGRGFTPDSGHGDGDMPCADCGETGWAEAPRLYSGQREEDEDPDEFEARCLAEVAEDPEGHLGRAEIVRLDSELVQARRDTWGTSRMMLVQQRPRSPGACEKYNNLCEYFGVCTGTDSIDNDERFVDSDPHPELDFKTDQEG